jgi:hypothetical protein
LIIAAPFSAIMIVGALVLVEVTAGITAAVGDELEVRPLQCRVQIGAEGRRLTGLEEAEILDYRPLVWGQM